MSAGAVVTIAQASARILSHEPIALVDPDDTSERPMVRPARDGDDAIGRSMMAGQPGDHIAILRDALP